MANVLDSLVGLVDTSSKEDNKRAERLKLMDYIFFV